METAVAAAQSAALSHPNQSRIEALRSEIVAAKLALKTNATDENQATVDKLMAERKALTDERDAELNAAKAAARQAVKDAAVRESVQAAARLAGMSEEQLAAEDSRLRAQVAELQAKRSALAAARVRSHLENRIAKLKSELTPVEQQFAKEQGLI